MITIKCILMYSMLKMGMDSSKIITLEYYSIPFSQMFPTNIDKSDFEDLTSLYMKYKVQDIEYNQRLISQFNNLVVDTSVSIEDFQDFRCLVILNGSAKNKIKLWVSSTGYILNNDVVYKRDYKFLTTLLEPLPEHFQNIKIDSNQ